MASVGETSESIAAKGLNAKTTSVTLKYSGRYIAENEHGDGIVKIITDKEHGTVLGVHMIGSYASEIIYGAAMMVEKEMRADDVKKLVFLSLEDERRIYSKDDLVRIYRDMAIIREFETMLNEIKTKSVYNGVEYTNPGPAHLSIGQEASAVGEAYCLDIDDFTFGSHRSHGEILAKGLSAINKLSDTELYDVMKNFLGGETLKVVEGKQEVKGNTKALIKVWAARCTHSLFLSASSRIMP